MRRASADEMLPLNKIKFEMGRILRKASERALMPDEDAFTLTMQLQEQFESVRRTIPAELRSLTPKEDAEGNDQLAWRKVVLQAVGDWLILALHRRYYVPGWLDPRYRTSRDLCFTCASGFLSLFAAVLEKKFFSLEEIKIVNSRKDKKDHPLMLKLAAMQSAIGRISSLARLASSSALLLQHHIFMSEWRYAPVAANVC